MQEQQNYGAYTGSPQYDGPPQHQHYDVPPQGQHVPPVYDDAFMDAFAQRLSQRIAQGPQGKIYPQVQNKSRASSGQRLALAVVSVLMLVASIGAVTGLASIAGLVIRSIVFGVAALVILLINVVFNLNN